MSEHPADSFTGRFSFGENWVDYARRIDDSHVEQAVRSLRQLLGLEDLRGKRVLDIGSGSGVHAVAALRLGAAHVDAIDFDPQSVEATTATLTRFSAGQSWNVERKSVFDLSPEIQDRYDIVYSWGVLHHTGALHPALRVAASMVRPGGFFVFALYRRTVLCPLWKVEKCWYANASTAAQAQARRFIIRIKRTMFAIAGRDFDAYVEGYKARRGMLFEQDLHDWMGGWPYESISPMGVERAMKRLGLEKVREFAKGGYFLGVRWTEFGSGCDEFVYQRPA